MEILQNIALFLAFASPVSCLVVFYCYWRLPLKNFGAKMIVTLSAADFIFHTTFIGSVFIPPGFLLDLDDGITRFSFSFSVLWSFCIAFLIHKLISRNKRGLRLSKYYRSSLLIVSGLSIALSVIEYYALVFYQEGDDLKYELAIGVSAASYLIALFLTTFYYILSIRILKKEGRLTSIAAKQFINTLYRYAFIQLITAGPSTIYKELCMLTHTYTDELIEQIFNLFILSMGLTNSLAYFFTRDGFGTSSEPVTDSDEDPSDDEPVSFYSDVEYRKQLITEAYN